MTRPPDPTEGADQARRQLMEWLSHDLRTPIAGIQALTEALEDGVVSSPDDVAHYARLIRAETTRLAQRVEDLLEMSEITSGALMPGVGPGGSVSDAEAVELDESRAREA